MRECLSSEFDERDFEQEREEIALLQEEEKSILLKESAREILNRELTNLEEDYILELGRERDYMEMIQ